MGRRTTATVAALAGVVLVSSGCESGTNGTATPSTVTDTSAATAALWDPCTQVTDQILRQVGVDPATKKSGVVGIEEPGFKVCGWNDPAHPWNYSLGVWSTIHTVETFRNKTDNVDFTAVTINGRSGFTFRDQRYDLDEACDLIFPTSFGAVEVTIFNVSAKGRQVPPCERASTAAKVLLPVLPH
ncbi:DUF3558 domain-containing protein [Nocardia beijingensis]|uniref:DUF3558 domain-containing protein n=1 Tax=Nocardia beijingensis TaxID=95162 RepID=UPI001893CA49|nr:DUF3558 domain-containing protein [Nocardia beijingensis]MBF6468898.1 DUF3558 domain-containing protein [Nocardia beijingensis]